jgi:hypothetical protein
MKNTVKITACGVISALAVVLMLATNIPVMLYTVPAVTGILFMIPAIEFNSKWAFLCFGVTAVLSFILPTEREAFVMFVGLLGYYPILKMLIERLPSRPIGFLLKFIAFNLALAGCFFVIVKVLGLPVFQNDRFGLWVTVGLVFTLGNVAFWVYDFTLTRLIGMYFIKFRRTVRKALGIKGKH